MSELERWAIKSPGIIPTKEERRHTRAVANLVNETRFAGLQVDAEAALAARIMERAVDIDQYRRSLAGGDETLNAVLTRVELNFIDKAARHQRNFQSEFPS